MLRRPGGLSVGGALVGDDGVADLGAGRLDGREGEGLDDALGKLKTCPGEALRVMLSEFVVGLIAKRTETVKVPTGLLKLCMTAIVQAVVKVLVCRVRPGNGEAQAVEQVAGAVKGGVISAADGRAPFCLG